VPTINDIGYDLLNRPLTRRQLFSFLSVIFGPPVMLSSYGYLFETRNLKVESLKLSVIGFPGRLRVVHLSDFHFSNRSQFTDRIVNAVNNLKPDHIYITGDLVDKKDYIHGCLEWLTGFKCSNIFFSPGNWEHWSGTLNDGLSEKLNEIGIITLNNTGKIIDAAEGPFYLAGIDDAYYGTPNAFNAFKNNKFKLPTIILSHSPLGIDVVNPMRPQVVLSGHTHGGQIRIPGIGAIKTPPGSGNYEQGLYLVNGTKMYVNRGIGTSIIPFRIFCPPEIALIEIERA
jgi:predicted MPP superfamily phosphohydrolase